METGCLEPLYRKGTKRPKTNPRAYPRAQGAIFMKTLATPHRKAVNRAAHAFALKVELQTRERWVDELTQALQAGASFAEIQHRIAALAKSHQCN